MYFYSNIPCRFFKISRINRNNIEKLNREIINVNKIMMKNIDSLLERDGYLNEIDSLSKSVMSSSRNFEKNSNGY